MFGSNPSKARMLSRKFRDGVQATATKYIPQDKALNFAIDAWKKQVAKCNGIAKELASKKKSCNGNQAVFEQYSCSYYLGVVSNCKNSKTAYTKAANAFAAEKASVKILEKDRKAEFTGLMKAHCILKAISGSKGQLSMAKLDKCKSVGISTAKLNLQYLAPPAKLSCTPTPLYPCQSQFLKAEYSGMPKGTTPAKCTPCAGAKPPVPAQCKTASAIPNKGTRLITTPYKGLCDNRLKSGWYKYPGHKMPEKSPGKMKCGTHAPGYLTSSHPSSKGATKSIRVCYHWSRPCQWSQNILVTNCGGGQFVYKLAKTPFCSGSFCFKRAKPAPPPRPKPSKLPRQCKTASMIPAQKKRLVTTPYKGLCDRNVLRPGWYKYPGHKMPEKSPGKMKCGTHAPGYLTSSHPSSKGATKS